MSTITVVRSIFLTATLLLSTLISAADLNLGSWNIKRLGHGGQQSFSAIASIANKLDFISIQEVMTEGGLNKLEIAIEKKSGESWSRMESHLVGSINYKEMYAFLWRDSAVDYTDGAVVYLDLGDKFIREPFSAKFRSKRDGSFFVAATVHILYGKGISDRTPEIKELSEYWQWLAEVYPNTPVMLMGDFNLVHSHPAWLPLKQYAKPLIINGASTLSSKDGRYANLYDNIWVGNNTTLSISHAGIIDFPMMLGWNHEKSRKHVSDHAPVYVSLGNAILNSATIDIQPPGSQTVSQGAFNSISHTNVSDLPSGVLGAVRGNINSDIYHRPDCPSYNKIAERNRIEFKSAAKAISAGYRIAGNCH
ncbi:MAG: DNAse [Pseudomonas sp.]